MVRSKGWRSIKIASILSDASFVSVKIGMLDSISLNYWLATVWTAPNKNLEP